ncbi:hypothetical protein Q1695_001780 [Nippostrongylus brasiliensis]|nr:hypothetical protein Q1695_001780 [Nippostrongylus brasiliensis]
MSTTILVLLTTLPALQSQSLDSENSNKTISCDEYKTCKDCASGTDAEGRMCEWCEEFHSCNHFLLNFCTIETRIWHPFNCPLTAPQGTYDENFARTVVLPLIGSSSASSKSELSALLNGCFDDVVLINRYEVRVRRFLSTWSAFQVYFPRSRAVALIFRGTMSKLLDEAISFVFHRKVNFSPTGGRVVEYYLHAFRAIWESGMREDFDSILKAHPHSQIWCFGHSLGGGMASLAAAQISAMYGRRSSIHLITMGQPRIGDISFAVGHGKLVPNSVRIVHNQDPIPGLPPRVYLLGELVDRYAHHRYEVRYPFNMSQGAQYDINPLPERLSDIPFIFRAHPYAHLTYFNSNLSSWHHHGCQR